MATESTPLLQPNLPVEGTVAKKKQRFSSKTRLLITAFVLSLSFSFTQTPLFYAFREITCNEYYRNHPIRDVFLTGDDRCNVREIEALTATRIATMSSVTTVSGILNLLVTGWLIKNKGLKFALMNQTFWPCVRNVCQITSIYLGTKTGIRIIQATQTINILGGGAGYLLTANQIIAQVVTPAERTNAFGLLQGIAMLATSFGYTLGGLSGDLFGTPVPFEITLGLLIFATLFSAFFMPYFPPDMPTTSSTPGVKPPSGGVFSFLAPLKVLAPYRNEVTGKKEWGVTWLALGVFGGVLATGFVPMMLQLTATNSFGFTASTNGYLMSSNSLIRAAFLALIFPRIISWGRGYVTRPTHPSPVVASTNSNIPTHREDFDPAPIGDVVEEPAKPLEVVDEKHGSHFDLIFLRWSMVLDALLTGLTAGSTHGYHIYLAACIIPFASGTAPAAKGVVMELIPKPLRSDALSAIALVERLAQVSTIGLFGMLFSKLSEMGIPTMVFIINAGLALLAAFVLAFVKFPKGVKVGEA